MLQNIQKLVWERTAWFSRLYDIRPGNWAGLFFQYRSPQLYKASGCCNLTDCL